MGNRHSLKFDSPAFAEEWVAEYGEALVFEFPDTAVTVVGSVVFIERVEKSKPSFWETHKLLAKFFGITADSPELQ